QAAVALSRFGLGRLAGEPLPGNPRNWLLDQFERYAAQSQAWAAEPPSEVLLKYYSDYQRDVRGQDELAARQRLAKLSQERYRASVNARAASALTTQAPFAERLVHFWSNHFAVSVDKSPLALLAGSFEAEAIRPHVFGRFEDLLLAAERHPAMLLYLDQARSTGPSSPVAMRTAPERQRGLNENLAREILELHTLGVRTGYTQEDVIQLARALTGWSVSGLPGLPANGRSGVYSFSAALHEPGTRSVLARTYSQRGEAQAVAILRDLAAHPATAKHIAGKLARHFAGDDPPPSLEERLAETYLLNGGDLASMYRVLVESPECWAGAPRFKTPWDWSVSALRGLGWCDDIGELRLASLLTQLGQPAWRPGSPAGYADTSENWMAPDLLLRRVEVANRLAEHAATMIDARSVAAQLLPGGVSDVTATAISRAESPSMGLAMLLASPEFLRR
ncbi:MAG TPA: DUF1800 domain-containing protein, partial [Verrucomicrobiales bacterium]|nr:DUF1800 domain-containing protein [Verrucomicrobiales bacterium]